MQNQQNTPSPTPQQVQEFNLTNVVMSELKQHGWFIRALVTFTRFSFAEKTNSRVRFWAWAVKIMIVLVGLGIVLKATTSSDEPTGESSKDKAVTEKKNAPKNPKEVIPIPPPKVDTKKNENTIETGVSYDLAPASVSELKEPNVRAYIERFSKVAVAEMDKFGIPASITMAQAIIESRSGTSVLAVRNNNHFGIKCFSKTCSSSHCSRHTDDSHKDFFIKYKDGAESFRAHSEFLMKYRYRELLKQGKNYKAWAKGLKEFGYATDQAYDKKIIAVIERYELNKLDDL